MPASQSAERTPRRRRPPHSKPASGCAHDTSGPGAQAHGVDSDLKAANLKHLKRIEGQVRGIAAMIQDDRYCADIIQQTAAVQESLRSVARNLLRNHLIRNRAKRDRTKTHARRAY